MSRLKKEGHTVKGGSWEDEPCFCKRTEQYRRPDGVLGTWLGFRVILRNTRVSQVLRGGSWVSPSYRVAARIRDDSVPVARASIFGFRVLRRKWS